MFDEDLRRLADEAGSAAEAAHLTDLVRRARRRRWLRRTSTGVVGLAAVAAVGVAAITVPGQVDSGPTTPASSSGRSPQPTPTRTQPMTKRFLMHHPAALVNQPGSHIQQASYADAQHAAALWEVCTPVLQTEACPQVVTWTSDGWATAHAARIPKGIDVFALPDGSTFVWLGRRSFVLGPDGSRHAVTFANAPIARRVGGSFTNLSSVDGARPIGLLDSRNETVYPPLTSPSTRCVYDDQWDPNGTIWEYGASHCGPAKQLTVAWSTDLGRTWSTRRIPKQPVLGLVVAADRTALLLGSNEKGRRDLLEGLMITHERGRGVWPLPIAPPSSRTGVWSTAVADDGSLFVTDGSTLWTSALANWLPLQQVSDLGFSPGFSVREVKSVGHVVIAYGTDASQIAVSSDDGRNWHLVSPRP